ncbi:MAG: lanthionine synthetase LanC family protein [Acidobacteriota bacterium]|nr:lanthionine synthetase LanC family protein [Acidobacteriota bacterium]
MIFALLLYLMSEADRPYLAAAEQAAVWLQSRAVKTENGQAWQQSEVRSNCDNHSLYSGNPGPVLFYLNLHRVTGNRDWLREALAGARHMAYTVETEIEYGSYAGLYTGLAGIAFTFLETYRATGDPRWHAQALRCIEPILGDWPGGVTDIIAGYAGTGLFLLEAADRLKKPRLVAKAEELGDVLIEEAHPKEHGLEWKMTDSYNKIMPNFSHGTAGIAYFLARLAEVTGKPHYLDAATAGAHHLLTQTRPNGLAIYYTPGGEDISYLGWCHGPAGTSRLYFQLWQQTKDEQWLKAYENSLTGLCNSGIPGKRPAGFWNNVGICCGSSGVAESLLDAHRAVDDQRFLALSKTLVGDLLTRSTREAGGLKWIQAEHRVRPELLQAQTGYMQGAAGIGIQLLRMDAFSRGAELDFRLPDSPYGE